MKKLLVLSVAMAGATTLLADTSVGFETTEGYPTAPSDMTVTTTEGGVCYWDDSNPSQQTGSIVAYSNDGVTAPTETSGTQYFHVDSGSDTVLRNSVPHDGANAPTYNALGEYMDAYVQFTAADEPESLTGNADKIRFYLLKSVDAEENETLQFHVCAGNLATALNTVTPTDYAVTFDGITPAENTWYRLVIKTIANISGAESTSEQVPGFVIFLDGKAATCSDAKGDSASAIGKLIPLAASYNDAGTLFPSMISTSNDESHQKLIGLGFRGTGNVDNIAFTTAAPADYAKDPTIATPIELYIDGSSDVTECTTFAEVLTAVSSASTATAKLNKSFVAPEEGFALDCALTIDLNGNTLTDLLIMAGEVSLVNTSSDAATVATSSESAIVLAEGTLNIGGSTGAIVVEGDTTVGGTLNILSENVKFKTLPSGDYTTPNGYKDALESGVDGYYVLVAEGGSGTPTVDPVAGTATFDTEAEANAATVAVPAAVANTGVTAAEYDAYFTKTTIPPAEEGGKYTVTATLNKAAVLPQDVGEVEAETEMLEGLVSIAIGEATGVTIATKKGLYYWIDGTKELGGSYTAGTAELGDGTSQELTKPTLDNEDGKAFYKVSVGVEAPAAE